LLERARREQCQDLIRELDILDPWDFGVFCERLQERRGRSLEVLPILPVRTGFPNGLFLPSDTVDRIYTVEGMTPYHREHIALHEIGHLLLGHEECGLDVMELAPIFFPHLDPALVKMVLGRSEYSNPQEQQVEYFASLVMAQVDERRMPRTVEDPDIAEVLGRLEASWGHSPWQR
jgi:hypothetical protein